MFTNIRKKIESKREASSLFWLILVRLKDGLWRLSQVTEKFFRKIEAYPLIKFPHSSGEFSADPGGRAEIHSLVCHKHLGLYLLAVKSFLRFYQRVAVVAHDDGSLTNFDKKILTKQIKNVTIIDLCQADRIIIPQIAEFEKISNYRQHHLIAKQLLDYLMLAKTDKIISLDSDTLFLKQPQQIIDWIENNSREILYSYEASPRGQEAFLSTLNCDLPPNFCAGFFCLNRQILNLELIELLLSRAEPFDWWTTQNIYPALISRAGWANSTRPLDPNQYQSWCNFDNPEPIFRHYWTSNGLTSEYLRDLHQINRELKSFQKNPPLQAQIKNIQH
ncbi:MAG TPA: hypothetical protein PK619_01525 [bacterium]|nr:hypothetical protein [bacterium]HPN80959.1 hypothetical protein [bacterium]HPW39379.1 hypothetical protein [bacterium]